ncbi:YiiX/YebB-like N1pC/P60 family cysteine hydrolase [Bacillus sp. Bos-x628]|uniref:YiiX/YebB-like N1pC/P60 family cysteine hydrolase n=1 Tax=Bacillus maqinnsis TaxID=3229854 RepID=UPI00338E28F7
MTKGNIIFVRKKNIISKLIRLFDNRGKFSHVVIAVSKDEILEANINMVSRIKKFNSKEYSYYEILDLGLSSAQQEKVVEISKEYIGKKYDYAQIFGYVLKNLFHLKGKNLFNNPNNLICSELVFDILDRLGITNDLGITGEIRGIDLTPNELYDLLKYLTKSIKKSQS